MALPDTTRILLVLTGGTIASRSDGDGVISLDSSAVCTLVDDLWRQDPRRAARTDLEVIQPIDTFSEDATPSTWTTVADRIVRTDLSSYDGIEAYAAWSCAVL